MSKRIKYRPIKRDELIDLSLALTQAMALLDGVADYALATHDEKLQLELADRWIEIGKMFAIEPPEEVIDTNDNVESYGFGGGMSEVKDEDE
jgi:hypothetical protein